MALLRYSGLNTAHGGNRKEPKKVAANALTLSEERIAYLEGLVSQARTAAAVFTQYTQQDVDRIVKPMVLAGSTHIALRHG